MIYILESTYQENSFRFLYDYYSESLNEQCLSRIQKFRNEKDKGLYILGRILLLEGIKLFDINTEILPQLYYNYYGKPHFNTNLHFNISHSGNKVICAIALDYEVGIDLEEIREMESYPLDQCFTKNERDFISKFNNCKTKFYDLWCRKEALIKADGSGLSIDLQSFEVLNNLIPYNNYQFMFYNLKIDSKYSSSLCLKMENKSMPPILRKFNLKKTQYLSLKGVIILIHSVEIFN